MYRGMSPKTSITHSVSPVQAIPKFQSKSNAPEVDDSDAALESAMPKDASIPQDIPASLRRVGWTSTVVVVARPTGGPALHGEAAPEN